MSIDVKSYSAHLAARSVIKESNFCASPRDLLTWICICACVILEMIVYLFFFARVVNVPLQYIAKDLGFAGNALAQGTSQGHSLVLALGITYVESAEIASHFIL